jgi:hypothetical protein
MDPDPGRHDREIGPVPEPRDQVVGTIGPPTWMGTIPAGAWLFIALAAADGAYRIWREGPQAGDQVSVGGLAGLVLSVVGGAAIVLLPGAILVGRSGVGRAGSWLVQGGVALAIAELLRLIGYDVLNAVAGAASFDPESSSRVPDLLARSIAIEIPAALLRIFGLARIGLGLRSIAAPTRTFGRILFAAPAAALAVLLLADLLTIQVSQAGPANVADALGLAYNLLILVSGAVILVLWAWIAAVASRQEGQSWRWITIGAAAIALASVVTAIGWIAGYAWATMAEAQTIVTGLGFAAGVAQTFGAVLLVLGFSQGFDAAGAGDGPRDAAGNAPAPGSATPPPGA